MLIAIIVAVAGLLFCMTRRHEGFYFVGSLLVMSSVIYFMSFPFEGAIRVVASHIGESDSAFRTPMGAVVQFKRLLFVPRVANVLVIICFIAISIYRVVCTSGSKGRS